ncbi:hypothetical protein [Campylobacter helveticus]|uniref:hypothetical protein n=1 Tax=Campylobacter helveticus TaxID=28898 RepID=UPI0010539AA3|nr:hypothetical protein [Campylobacter helveticus]QBL12757.1 hypothetical protein A0073_10030 [Campylobacter helveticus]
MEVKLFATYLASFIYGAGMFYFILIAIILSIKKRKITGIAILHIIGALIITLVYYFFVIIPLQPLSAEEIEKNKYEAFQERYEREQRREQRNKENEEYEKEYQEYKRQRDENTTNTSLNTQKGLSQ